tara:strand:- start:200 stop:1234 length:1035 start_codon:yes stop_codon:yes gene_type:complete
MSDLEKTPIAEEEVLDTAVAEEEVQTVSEDETVAEQTSDEKEVEEIAEKEMPPALKKFMDKKKKNGDMKKDDDSDDDDEEEDDDDEKKEGHYGNKKKMKMEKKGKMKEDIDAIFSGEDLGEEFKSKAKIIFEAAVDAKVDGQMEEIIEYYENKAEQEATELTHVLTEKLDEYLDYFIKEWKEENQVAITANIKTEIAEDFLIGLKNLFAEHYVDIPQEKVDLVSEFSEKVEGLEKEYDKAIEENKKLSQEITEFKKEMIISGQSQDLTEVQSEKLKSLSEKIEYVSDEDYTEKVSMVRSKYFDGEQEIVKADVNDENESSLQTEEFNPTMQHYVNSIAKGLKKV